MNKVFIGQAIIIILISLLFNNMNKRLDDMQDKINKIYLQQEKN